MKLINPKFEIIEQQEGRKGIYKQIELAGRTCYKSERNITPTSANKFVNNMINSGHGSMLEHGTVYLKMHYSICDRIADHNVQDYINNKYSKVRKSPVVFGIGYYVTTNLRVLVENN